MGNVVNQDILHGILIPDDRFSIDNVVDKGTTATDSKYSQADPKAGVAEYIGDEDGQKMALKASGGVEEDAFVEVRTMNGGHPVPEDGGYIWTEDTSKVYPKDYNGADSNIAFTDWEVLDNGIGSTHPHPNVIRLQSGKLALAGIEETLNVMRVYIYDPATGNWEKESPNIVDDSDSQYALCQLPNGRLLIYWVTSDGRQVGCRYSDNDGDGWSEYSNMVLGTQLLDSAGNVITVDSLRVGYSNRQMLLIASFIDASHANVQNMIQYASIDDGHNFDLVSNDFFIDDPPGGAYPAANPNIISVPSGGFVVIAHSRNTEEATHEYRVAAYRLGSASTPLNEADVTYLTDFFGTPVAVGFVLALTGWIDEDNIVYALNQDAKFKDDVGVNTEYRIQLYRSLDFGVTWLPYNGSSSSWGVLTNNLHSFDAASTGGKTFLCTRWTSVTTHSYDESSVGVLGMGGFGGHTLPDADFVDDDRFLEVNSLGWGPATQPIAAGLDNFAAFYIPIELPNNSMGWTLGAGSGGTPVLNANGSFRITTAAGQIQFYQKSQTSTSTSSISRGMYQFIVEVSGGDKTTDQVAVRIQFSDNINYGYDIVIRLESDGYRVYDNIASAYIDGGAIAKTLTTATWFRVALDKEDNVKIWTSKGGHVLDWDLDVNGATTDVGAASGFNNVVYWGHLVAAGNSSSWRMMAYNYRPRFWSKNDPLSFADGWDSTDSLRPKSYSTNPQLLAGGIRLAASGGPTTLNEKWRISADYEHPLKAAHPYTDPSPSRRWRSTDTVETFITWRTTIGLNSGMIDNNIMGVFLLKANFRTAYFEWYDEIGLAWVTLASLDAADGYSPLKFKRWGTRVVPDEDLQTQGREWLFYEDHVGDTFDLGATNPVEPFAGKRYMKIAHNTEGSWVGLGGKTKRPVVELDRKYYTGDEVEDGTGHIWRTNFGAVISGVTEKATRWRLRIPAQDTADDFFEIGQIVIGPIAVLGKQYDRGYRYTHLHPVNVTNLTDGTQRVTKDGEEQRRFTFALAEGAVDMSSVEEDDPSPDYRTAEDGSALAVATPHDTTRTIEGIIRRTNGPNVPVLLLTAIPRDTTGGSGSKRIRENRRRTFVWGRIQTDPSVEAFRGTEGICEKERYQIITLEETI